MKIFWTFLFIYFIYWFVNNLFSANRSRNFSNQNPPQPDGKTTIKTPPHETPKKINDNEGEYIDYKEVKD